MCEYLQEDVLLSPDLFWMHYSSSWRLLRLSQTWHLWLYLIIHLLLTVSRFNTQNRYLSFRNYNPSLHTRVRICFWLVLRIIIYIIDSWLSRVMFIGNQCLQLVYIMYRLICVSVASDLHWVHYKVVVLIQIAGLFLRDHRTVDCFISQFVI